MGGCLSVLGLLESDYENAVEVVKLSSRNEFSDFLSQLGRGVCIYSFITDVVMLSVTVEDVEHVAISILS